MYTEIIPYLGAGFVHNYTSPEREAFAVNVGLINRFRLSSALDLNLELSAMGTESKFDGEPIGQARFRRSCQCNTWFDLSFPCSWIQSSCTTNYLRA